MKSIDLCRLMVSLRYSRSAMGSLRVSLSRLFVRRAVEAMCTDTALGKPDGVDNVFKRAELKRSNAETLADCLNKSFVLGGTGPGICLKIAIVLTFALLDNTACYKLKFTLRR